MDARSISNPGVYVADTTATPPIQRADTSVTAFVGAGVEAAVRDYRANGGRRWLSVPDVAALDDAEQFDLVVLTPDSPGAAVAPGVVAEAAASCERLGALLLLDLPPTWASVDDVVRAAGAGLEAGLGTLSANAAAYFPRLAVPAAACAEASVTTPVAPSVAGVLARTDFEHGVWKAPAGQEATLATDRSPAFLIEERDVARLAAVGVNPVRELPGRGPVVWGARTLAGADGGDPEWRYVPVRRTALFVERSLRQGTGWVVFEPNDEPLWASLRRDVTTFLTDLWRDAGWPGPRAEDAFFVRCDATTTTPADVAAGVVNLVVGFAHERPAEFVILQIALSAAPTVEPRGAGGTGGGDGGGAER